MQIELCLVGGLSVIEVENFVVVMGKVVVGFFYDIVEVQVVIRVFEVLDVIVQIVDIGGGVV